jgi:hypothetical protein
VVGAIVVDAIIVGAVMVGVIIVGAGKVVPETVPLCWVLDIRLHPHLPLQRKLCKSHICLLAMVVGLSNQKFLKYLCFNQHNTLHQRFPTFLTRGALFRINFYGAAP